MAQQQREHNVTATFILGDLTHEKDNHSAALVNRAIDEMTRLRPPVYILRGNHDAVDPNNPYFKFLNCVDGFSFVNHPIMDIRLHVALIPHCRNQAEFDQACAIIRPDSAVMVHQTFDGAEAETGTRLSGLKTAALMAKKPWAVYAGDIHKPQVHGGVTYVGSPYTVRFGDNFNANLILLKDRVEKRLYFECPRKWLLHISHVNDLKNYPLKEHDQVKIIMTLDREEAVDWANHRRTVMSACKHRSLDVFAVDLKLKSGSKEDNPVQTKDLQTPEQVFSAFCQHEGVADAIRRTGDRLLRTELSNSATSTQEAKQGVD